MLRRQKKPCGSVWLRGFEQEINFYEGQSLLEVCRRNDLPIATSCGGMGTCTTCRIRAVSGPWPQRTPIEQEIADERGYSEQERLACQVPAAEGLVFEIPGFIPSND